MSEKNLVTIFCEQRGFRRYGHEFTAHATIAEVSDNGQLSAGSPAQLAITEAQFNDLQSWAKTKGSPLSYADPDEPAQQVAEANTRLRELREQLGELGRDREAAAAEVEKARKELAEVQAQREGLERELVQRRAEIEQRERAAKELEQRVENERQLLGELQERTETTQNRAQAGGKQR